MNRARLIGTLLALILLACIAVIVLDQRGAFGGGNTGGDYTPAPTQTTPTESTPTPEPAPSGDGGYGDL